MKKLSLFLLLAAATPLSAADVLISADLPAGTHYLKVVVGSDGATTVTQARVVKVGGVPSTPNPTDPLPTDPPTGEFRTLTELAASEARKIGRTNEAAVLQLTYAGIAQQIREGKLTDEQVGPHTKQAVDIVLRTLNATNRWAQWREALTAEMQSLGLTTSSRVASGLEAIAAGLQDAAGGANAALNLPAILKLLMAVLSKNPIAIAEAVLELLESLRSNRMLQASSSFWDHPAFVQNALARR